MAGLPTPDQTPEPQNRSSKTHEEVRSAIAPGAASALSKLMAGLLTPDHTPEPQKRATKPSTMQQRPKTSQDIEKNPRVSGPSSGGSVVQETPNTDVTTVGFHPNAFDDDTGSLGDSDDKIVWT